MKERPILFSAPMVRAILAGQKTQTRRILPAVFNSPPSLIHTWHKPGSWRSPNGVPDGAWGAGWHGTYPSAQKCPYGQPGDRLWVRETWAWPGEEEVIYRADQWAVEMVEKWKTDPNYPQVKWRPSIFMQRKHSRILLEVKAVRVERLHGISEADARAEGVERSDITGMYHPYPFRGEVYAKLTASESFRSLWEHINGAESWDANPWVWVVEFSRCQP